MSDRAALLRAVLADPDADTPREVYADFLDDHADDYPDPDAARARAELIRVQVEQARIPDWHDYGSVEQIEMSRHLTREQKASYRTRRKELHDRAMALCDAARPTFGVPEAWCADAVGTGEDHWPTLIIRRGFGGCYEGPAADWLTHADAILAEHPVRRVRLTTVPDITAFDSASPPYTHTCWFPGRAMSIAIEEREILRGGSPAAVLDLRRDVVRKLLTAEWPAIEFDLPPNA